ncbi:histone deacetylase family protein [Marinihelvus fidelis]|uniref:Histone deacetylase family protein n=1 Tax=Marinihelvus fidelis TaxID=2613842 RepID=A0A5N0T7A8_9GAMM|nr:histone deacetylase family protein [Marinihelvus fidelis]KAA9130840.1 histone deacetylase family protein [Marinihelvus fidelis]
MSTLVIHHDDCRRHDPGPRHPEQVRRTAVVLEALEAVNGIERLPAPLVTPEQAGRVHGLEFQDWLQSMEPQEGRAAVGEADNLVNRGSMDASRRGSGAMCYAIDELLAGRAANAFCVTRPPGHHSGTDFAMGFCLFNHVAIGARHALASGGIERVAIVDFDVHHGNGTQQVFEDDPRVMFVSSHQMPLYPGSGHPEETGAGNIMNLPLAPGTGGDAFRATWSRLGLPAIDAFEPDLVLVSAGFDAHSRDPLGALELEDNDYDWITRELLAIASRHAGGRLVSILEGGYDLEGLASSAAAHTRALVTGR